MIYLDNSATTSPKPQTVIEAVDRALRKFSANPGRGGHRPSMNTSQAIFSAREKVKKFFRMSDVEKVIFTSGCTESLNTVIKGLLKKGDHVVISCFEHNSVVRPLHRLKMNGMIDYTVVGVDLFDDDQTIQNFRNAVNSKTKLFVCTQGSNAFGARLPTERLCALAHSYGIKICVDAAQTAGIIDIDMINDRYDYLCCAGHKGLYAPTGTGLLLINDENMLHPLKEGGTGSESALLDMPEYYPDRMESGTANIPGILGLSAGIDFVNAKGKAKMLSYETKLMQKLYCALKKNPQIVLYTSEPDVKKSVPLLSFNVRNTPSETVAQFLDKKYDIAVRAGLHCAPLAHNYMNTSDYGTVRVSPSVFTTEKEIEILIKGVNNFVHSA